MSTASATSTDDDDDDDVAISTTTTDQGIPVVKVGHGHDTATVTVAGDENAHWVGYNSHHGWNPGAPWWLILIGMVLLAKIVQTAIRARHGDLRTDRQRRRDERTGLTQPNLTATRENELLAQENERLKAQAIRLEDRVAVLERIVTDPAKRVSDEIDALR